MNAATRIALVALTGYAVLATRAVLKLQAETTATTEGLRRVIDPMLTEARIEGATAAAQFVRDEATAHANAAMGTQDRDVSTVHRIVTGTLFEVADAIDEIVARAETNTPD